MIRIGFAFLFAAAAAWSQTVTQGTLDNGQIECPLKHTSVKGEISGAVARVEVLQEFQNSSSETIEAVYTFPLPHDAAVDSMTMTIGGRVIQGKIKTREEAQALYAAARDAGKAAGLLDQHRPNIFRQAVANITPGAKIQIAIRYVQLLSYLDGNYEFVFPMVVGPRYRGASMPAAPRALPQGIRPGHDISIELTFDAGMPVSNPVSKSHEIDVVMRTVSSGVVRLRNQNTIPNKDFILRYDASGSRIQDTVLTHRSAKGGYVTLTLQPPEHAPAPDVSPKELVFVLDTSGSMMGFPIEKAKEAMRLALDGMHPRDTFNLITFSGDTEILFPEPVPATRENLAMAQLFLNTRSGFGGTEMMKAIRAALDPSTERGRLRVVCFMTDGFVGNDMEILAEVRKHTDVRVFAFGIGQAVNRFLLDGMAQLGRGEVEYVGLQDDGSAAARRFHERVRSPLLTDIRMDWGGLAVTDVYPKQIPDLFSAKPVMVTGRFASAGKGIVRLIGKTAGVDVERTIAVALPQAEASHEALGTLWARGKIADLTSHDYLGVQNRSPREDIRKEITQLGLEFQLTTQFTSFVAVEEMPVTAGGKTRRVEVPLSLPEGMQDPAMQGMGTFGYGGAMAGVVGGVPGGVAGGTPGGVIGGIIGSVPTSAPPPPPPPARKEALPAALTGAPPAMGYGRIAPANSASKKLDEALTARIRTGDSAQMVEVQLLLRDPTPATLDRLREIGLEIGRIRNYEVTGRIAVGKLQELAAVNEVRFIVEVKR